MLDRYIDLIYIIPEQIKGAPHKNSVALIPIDDLPPWKVKGVFFTVRMKPCCFLKTRYPC